MKSRTLMLGTACLAAPLLSAAGLAQTGSTLVYDNVDLVSQQGAGAGGADLSETVDCILAYQCATDQGDYLIARVPAPAVSLRIDRVRVFGLECNPTTQSTITGMTLQAWDGLPDAPGSTVLFGDRETNRLSATGYTNIQRVLDQGNLASTTWPIMSADCATSFTVHPGTNLHLVWSLDGSGELCGNQPATPPNRSNVSGLPDPGRWLVGDSQYLLRPSDFGCQLASVDDLPYQLHGEPIGGVGTSYCGPAIPNSGALSAVISAAGDPVAAANNLSLTASDLPPGQFGYFLASRTQGFFNPPGSSGIICLSGNIGRYTQAGNIIQGPTGSIAVDLGAIPVNPPTAVMAGDTWFFQCWYRDIGTSNFTDGVGITFQ